MCSKFTGEHPCRTATSIKLLCNFIKVTPRHGCSPVNLLHIFRTPFLKNTSEGLLLELGTFNGSQYMHHEVAKFPTRDSRQSTVDREQLTVDSCDSPPAPFWWFFCFYSFVYLLVFFLFSTLVTLNNVTQGHS